MKNYIKLAFLLVCVTALSSCASVVPSNPPTSYLNNISSGSIGCPAEQIQTSNVQFNGQRLTPSLGGYATRWVGNAYTWTAQCNGRTYYCSGPANNVDTGFSAGGDNWASVKSASCTPAQS
jgi:hypothetical protein